MWWLVGLLGASLLGWGIFSTKRLLYPERYPWPAPSPLPLYTTHALSACDGAPFDVWFLEQPTPKGRLLLCHGYYADRYQVLGIAQGLRECGYEVLLIELRGHGRRAGPCTFGLQESQDARQALEWGSRRLGAANLPVGVMGLSMGAAVMCHVAATHPAVKAVVTDSLYAHLFPVIGHTIEQQYHLPSFPFSWITWCGLQLALRARLSRLDPARLASSLSQPLLAIYGGQDRRVPPRLAAPFYERWAGSKEQWFEPSVPHVKMFATHPKEYCRRVADFFDRALGAR